MSRLRFWSYAWSTAIGAMFFAMLVALGCGGMSPAQEAAIEKGTCVAIDDVAGALGGPAAEGLVTIACDAVGAWVLAKLDAVDAGPTTPPPAPPPVQVRRVSRRACVAAGICAPRPTRSDAGSDAGGGG